MFEFSDDVLQFWLFMAAVIAVFIVLGLCEKVFKSGGDSDG